MRVDGKLGKFVIPWNVLVIIMVTIKFIIEVVLLIVTLVIVLYWLYTNYSNILEAFMDWIKDMFNW